MEYYPASLSTIRITSAFRFLSHVALGDMAFLLARIRMMT